MPVLPSYSPVIWAVLLGLVGFSIASWTIFLVKWSEFRSARRANQAFLAAWRLGQEAGSAWTGPLAALYQTSVSSLSLGKEAALRSLRTGLTAETERLESGVAFLATTAATTPFIGLFGTVWGIMSAFQKIGEAGSASLAIVAPGVAEALLTTAIGLVAAIPAMVGYNFLQERCRRLVNALEDLHDDLKATRGDDPS